MVLDWPSPAPALVTALLELIAKNKLQYTHGHRLMDIFKGTRFNAVPEIAQIFLWEI